MNDFGYVIKELCALLVQIFNLHFVVFGVELTVGAMFLFACVVGLLLWFIRGLSE